jgi:hypothetical protein
VSLVVGRWNVTQALLLLIESRLSMHRVNLIVGLSESYTLPRHVGSVVIRGTRGILRAKVLGGKEDW